MWLFISCSAVVVECPFLKPCWCDANGIALVIIGSNILSSVLARGREWILVCNLYLGLMVCQVSGLVLFYLFSTGQG